MYKGIINVSPGGPSVATQKTQIFDIRQNNFAFRTNEFS